MPRTFLRVVITIAVVITLITSNDSTTPVRAATLQTDISGPAGSGQFSYSVTSLPNGNFVVTDPYYDAPGPVVDVGAVYLYNGATQALISTLTGSTTNDLVGIGGITALTNGNYVVVSSNWHNGIAVAGAVTWGNGTSGVSGVVSPANSLVGSTANDQVVYYGITALANGNYVVRSPYWQGVGAVTWGSGTSGVSGVVSAANSLVGSTTDDRVGYDVTALANGNYVVRSPNWDNGQALDAGAVTWGSGTAGVSGVISEANSLIGSTAYDRVGFDSIMELTNGNYVVSSYSWDNGMAADAGAVTWGDGTTGVSGVVSPAKSLVGSTAYDGVGTGLTALANGNYVVRSLWWDNGMVKDVGAVTWGNGTTGIRGVVSATNSLVGSTEGDLVGYSNYGDYDNGDTVLMNGNYVVVSPNWDNGMAADAGAVTWGDGTTGVSGVVSPANSLIGSTTGDRVGEGVTALANGNYVMVSPGWDNGMTVDVGAATWGNGTTGVSGVVSSANSLVGSIAYDQVGSRGVTALTNGNYVVKSPWWDNGMTVDVGAATWGNGITSVTGAISAVNSLVGSTEGDRVGYDGVVVLTNSNYVVRSASWQGVGAATWGSGAAGVSGVVSAANSLVGSATGTGSLGITALTNGDYVVSSTRWYEVGVVTWGSGTAGVNGVVSATNSLVGNSPGDWIGYDVTALTNGNYVVRSPRWDNGSIAEAGAITLGKSTGAPLVGPITAANSVRGTTAFSGFTMNFVYDEVNDQLVVGRPADNIVTLFSITSPPRVTSSVRVNPSPTNLASVGFIVTLSKSVTGVDAGDFALTASGVTGASITNVSGSGTTYTVIVNTGSGNGKIRLDVVDDDSIKDSVNDPLGGVGAGNGNYISGETYKVIKSAQPDTTGVFRPSNGLLYLKNSNTTGIADIAINYGLGGDYPVVGDWDGNGNATIGIYRNGSFYLRNSNTIGFADVVFPFGTPGDQPIAGDWDGDGVDTIGVYRPSTGQFLMHNSNSASVAEMSFYLGNVGDVGIAGDWDGDGKDTTGVFRPSNGIIFLKNTNETGFADVALNYGIPGDKPVTGDWNGDGIDTIGIYRNGRFYLRNSNTIGFADIVFDLGNPGDMPIAGNWDGLP